MSNINEEHWWHYDPPHFLELTSFQKRILCAEKRESNINSLLQKITNLSICSLFLAHTSKSQLTKTLLEIYKSDAALADEQWTYAREYISF